MGKLEVYRLENDVFMSNTYVLLETKSQWVWLVDVGDICKVKKLLTSKNDVKGCFITHSHFDHIYGLNELVNEFPDCVIYVSEYGKEGLFSAKLNFSFYHENPFVFGGGNVKILEDGYDVKLQENLFMNVVSTPGHDKGCLCYKVGDYFFTGDSYIPGIKTVTKLRGGNKEDNEKSLMKLKALFLPDTLICPGHGLIVHAKDILDS
ncbi:MULTISPECIES: MBL fold metallo-hydrolase [unclassified Butyricimonas]|uniref:MBL fold metallo-hydrolase n=1 Tax=unclassified Butyricimonas TaxID=2637652 RepID=UPI000C08A8C2|nr:MULTISPECIES: MBL fold metallo-hydrolase [unclassified Butyricimonas]